MPEALARARNDFQISRRTPARRGRDRGRLASLLFGCGRFFLRQLSARPATTIAGAGFAALMTGIAINALVLQTARHPAPLFASPRLRVEPPVAVAAAPAPRLAVAATPSVASAPAARPAAPAVKATEAPAPAGGKDPIAQFLKTGSDSAPAESRHAPAEAGKAKAADSIAQFLRNGHQPAAAGASTEPDAATLAAQRALMKLGYVVKPDGVMGSTTRQAIEQYERDHHLPVKGDLTQRIARALATAADAQAD